MLTSQVQPIASLFPKKESWKKGRTRTLYNFEKYHNLSLKKRAWGAPRRSDAWGEDSVASWGVRRGEVVKRTEASAFLRLTRGAGEARGALNGT